jgi:hypothetical protein
MDPRSGELVRDINWVDMAERDRFVPIPRGLYAEAVDRLSGNDRAFVPIRGESTLAAWARERIKVRTKNRKREKIARKSRQRNRA